MDPPDADNARLTYDSQSTFFTIWKHQFKPSFLPIWLQPAPEVAGWLFREWGHERPDSTLERTVLMFKSRSNVDRSPMALVAVAEGKPVGTASIVETEDPGDEYGPWVSGVFVLPEHRGRRIATQLMNTLELEAIQLGAQRLLLSAGVPELYRQLGYEPTGATKNGEPIMTKTLREVTRT